MNKQKKLDLAELEEKREKLSEELNAATDMIELLKMERDLPGLMEKYDDTYWMCKDGYNNKEVWNRYIHVINVYGLNNGDVNAQWFSLSSDGLITTGKDIYISQCEKQITREQFEKGLNELIRCIVSM
jgi:hypothetical protein